jgi:hypothetical protein
LFPPALILTRLRRKQSGLEATELTSLIFVPPVREQTVNLALRVGQTAILTTGARANRNRKGTHSVAAAADAGKRSVTAGQNCKNGHETSA